jgi:glycosyltransferase involved in cell wall biosynthesis
MIKSKSFAIAVVMPVYNEAEGIKEFLQDLNEIFQDYNTIFIIIDDMSTDQSVKEIDNTSKEINLPIKLIKNKINLGHGPSTFIALAEGAKIAQTVISMDGDGQFYSKDIKQGYDVFTNNRLDILEGVRVNRNDPWFRKTITFLLKYFVYFKSRQLPLDANTPLRFYKSDVLLYLLDCLEKNTSITNIFISVLSRRQRLKIGNYQVLSRQRRGLVETGSTWGSHNRNIPSKNFIKFCWRAFFEALKI